MSWADQAIKKLLNGEYATIYPRGNSMKGLIESGQEVRLKPTNPNELKIGDIVLVKVKGCVYLHKIKATHKNRYLIGNNTGGLNGWANVNAIYGVKMTKIIDKFDDKYYFLSNFYPANTKYDGVIYKTSEHAFQAAKTNDSKLRNKIKNAQNPGQAKKLGKQVPLRNDWEEIKYDIMLEIVRDKFTRNKTLGLSLTDTKDAELIEGNTWGDIIWGVCDGRGTNWLGKILMKVRNELLEKNNSHSDPR